MAFTHKYANMNLNMFIYFVQQQNGLISILLFIFQGVSFSGFLWDSSSGVELRNAALLEPPVVNGNSNHSTPQLYRAHFTVRKSKGCILTCSVNIYCVCFSLAEILVQLIVIETV